MEAFALYTQGVLKGDINKQKKKNYTEMILQPDSICVIKETLKWGKKMNKSSKSKQSLFFQALSTVILSH